jgi:hypothetical protein
MYVCRKDESGNAHWTKRDRYGRQFELAGAIHLPRTRLQELLREYPSTVLDTTLCFGNGLAREFFDDAKREHITDIPEGTETNIFFIQKKGEDKFTIGYSSVIHRIEKTEEALIPAH